MPAAASSEPTLTCDLDAADSIFAAGFRSHPMGTTGPGAVKKAWAAIREKYPEMRHARDGPDSLPPAGTRIGVTGQCQASLRG